jgi:hypothetical protein
MEKAGTGGSGPNGASGSALRVKAASANAVPADFILVAVMNVACVIL